MGIGNAAGVLVDMRHDAPLIERSLAEKFHLSDSPLPDSCGKGTRTGGKTIQCARDGYNTATIILVGVGREGGGG